MQNIRHLRKDEIQCRPSTVKEYGFSLLLYKDARCDMAILDETVGHFNWQRQHSRDNANCIVSIWDSSKGQWISKEDTGVESYTEKEKGLASDSFKRACFNWGIGRELYTAPFIWIKPKDGEVYKDGNTWKLDSKAYFEVSEIEIENHVITDLTIIDKNGDVRFEMSETSSKDNTTEKKSKSSKKSTSKKETKTEAPKKEKKAEKKESGGELKDATSPQEAIDIIRATEENPDQVRNQLLQWYTAKQKKDAEFKEQYHSEMMQRMQSPNLELKD